MNGSENISPYAAQILHDHRELHRQVGEISRVLARRGGSQSLPERHKLSCRLLVGLREHLAKHFGDEERDGYMEEALSCSPQLGPEATDLEREHPVILQALDHILQRLNRKELTEDNWAEVAVEFKRFARVLLAHEVHENRILQHGLNSDLDLE